MLSLLKQHVTIKMVWIKLDLVVKVIFFVKLMDLLLIIFVFRVYPIRILVYNLF